MRILKESFDALVQYQIRQLTQKYKNMATVLLERIEDYVEPGSLQSLLSSGLEHSMPSYFNTNGKQDRMTVE